MSGQTDDKYLHGHHSSILRSYDTRTARNSAAYLLPRLVPGNSLLDVGCGAGSITVDLAAAVAPGQVIGIDLSDPVLEKARALADARGVTNVQFEIGTVVGLEFESNRFDVVHAHQVLQHLTDPVAALTEMHRVCRPGGIVAARDADYAAMTWWPREPALDEWLALYRRVALDSGAQPDAGRRMLSWAQAAGLTDIEATAATWCYSTPAARELWGGSWTDRVVLSDFAARAIERGFATRAQLAEISAGWRRWTVAPDGWFAILHGEILAGSPAPSPLAL